VASIGKYRYEFWDIESSWTSDALLVRALTDWREDDDESKGLTFSLDKVQVEEDASGVKIVTL
jgi:hypothetical protein